MIYRRLPDQWPIDAELLMNQNVAQAHNVLPRHKTVSGLYFGTQPGDRFSNGREPLGNRVAKRIIGDEASFRSARDRFRDPVEGIQNVAQSLIVMPHISGGLRRAQPTESAASMRV